MAEVEWYSTARGHGDAGFVAVNPHDCGTTMDASRFRATAQFHDAMTVLYDD
jgi:hypothetical protein